MLTVTPPYVFSWPKVLDSGTIQELDCPFTLLQNKEGALYKMVQEMGQAEAAALLESAGR